MSDSSTRLAVGETAEFTKTITAEDIATFSQLSGDHDPVHTDEEYAKTTAFGRVIAHGALVMGLLSTTASMIAKRSKERGAQGTPVSAGYDRIRFTYPVFAGDTLTATYTIESVDEEARKTRAKGEIKNAEGRTCVVATHIFAWV